MAANCGNKAISELCNVLTLQGAVRLNSVGKKYLDFKQLLIFFGKINKTINTKRKYF